MIFLDSDWLKRLYVEPMGREELLVPAVIG